MTKDALYDRLNEVLLTGGERLMQAIKLRIVEAGKVKTGALRDSIAVTVDMDELKLTITALEYFNFLEYGTVRGIQPTDLLSETDAIVQETIQQSNDAIASWVSTGARDSLRNALSGLSHVKLTTN